MLSDKGRAAANPSAALPRTSEEIIELLRGKFPPAKRAILDAVIEAYPDTIGRDDLAKRAGASPTSSSYANNLSNLCALGFVERPSAGVLRASDDLFLTGKVR